VGKYISQVLLINFREMMGVAFGREIFAHQFLVDASSCTMHQGKGKGFVPETSDACRVNHFFRLHFLQRHVILWKIRQFAAGT
jgi:hypothetical protein